MCPSNTDSPLRLLALPQPAVSQIADRAVRAEYASFIGQLQTVGRDSVVLSDPYALSVRDEFPDGFTPGWRDALSAAGHCKLLLLSLFCRPFDAQSLWPRRKTRFISDQAIGFVFPSDPFSLGSNLSSPPFGLGTKAGLTQILRNPGLKALMDRIPCRSPLATMASEFVGEQPGNYGYQMWQVGRWSAEWTAVYCVNDADYTGYPFPWLLGFCRFEHLERNFVVLLREAAGRFEESSFYYTRGTVFGPWRLARLALSVPEYSDTPPVDIIDDLLMLDESLLERFLREAKSRGLDRMLERVQSIHDLAEEAGLTRAPLGEIIAKASGRTSLVAIRASLAKTKKAYLAQGERAKADRAQRLVPFATIIDAWVDAIAGPKPRHSMWAGFAWNDRKSRARGFLEEHILRDGTLPTGRHDLGFGGTWGSATGSVDFDDIAARVVFSARQKPT